MLVLALEFSRGCAAHAWVGTLVPTHASRPAQERFPRPGHARGERSISAGTPRHEQRAHAPHPTRSRGAHKGSTRIRKAARALETRATRRQGRHQGSTRRSLPQNEIARAQSHTQGPNRERRASTRANHRTEVRRFSSKAACSSAGDTRATE